MESINNRRTIRKYKQEDISASLLNDLLEKAFRASTMGNMQLYSVIVTRDKQMKERLAPAHFNQPMVTGAPVVLTFCADFNRFSKWCRERKAVPGYDNRLPELVMPVATITVGYPDEYPPQVDRLPIEGILHEELYHDYTKEDIDRIYRYKESLPENHQFIKENHKETLAQVFTEVRYKKSDNECMSVTLKETLKKQGFEK